MTTTPCQLMFSVPRVALAALLSFFFLAVSVPAQTKGDGAKVDFSIPAGEATVALKTFAKQSGVELLYSEQMVAGAETKAVSGQLAPRAALERMLEGTGLVATQGKTGGGFAVRKETEAEAKNDSSRPASDRAAAVTENGALKLDTFEVFGKKTLNMDIPRSRDDAQPYMVFGKNQIEQSGASNLNDFLKNRLTAASDGATPDLLAQNNQFKNGSSVNLRGLGTNQTLILIDGRRAPSFFHGGTDTEDQADINGIPISAVERIEVLPSTASGIYGGNATGGVINIILRRDYSNQMIGLTYENTFDTDTSRKRIDYSTGFSLEGGKTHVMINASHSEANALARRDRDFFIRGIARRVANNPARLFSASAPPPAAATNIKSANGSNLTLKSTGQSLNSPFTFAPVGYGGASSDGSAALIANAGKYSFPTTEENQSPIFGGEALVNPPVVDSFMATVRRQFGDKLELFADVSLSNNVSRSAINQFAASAINIPAAAAINPFNQAINVRAPVPPLGTEYVSRYDSRTLTLGAIAKLPADWQAEFDLTLTRNARKAQNTNFIFLDAATSAALANSGQDWLKNPIPSFDYSPYLTPALATRNRAWNDDAAIRIGGPLFEMRSGPLVLNGLLEYQDLYIPRESYSSNGIASNQFTSDKSRSVFSGYLETRIPLVKEGSNAPWANLLELSVAGRIDDYRTNGASGALLLGQTPTRAIETFQSINPTVAFRYQPVSSITIRGSYGTGFRPPGLNQLVSQPGIATQIFDLRRGGESIILVDSTGAKGSTGGNPNLIPEKSESRSLGIIIQPSRLPGLRLSIDWTKISKRDNITDSGSIIAAGGIVELESAYPYLFTRGPNLPGDLPTWPGPIVRFDALLVNIARAEAEAYDLQLDYEHQTNTYGTFSIAAAATWQTHYKTQILEISPVVENVGIGTFSGGPSNPLKFKGNTQLGWSKGSWRATWSARYLNSYVVSTSAVTILEQGALRVPSQVYHDFFVSYRFTSKGHTERSSRGVFNKALDGMEIQLGIKNVLNAEPPYDAGNSVNYYSFYGDPFLRSYLVSVKKKF